MDTELFNKKTIKRLCSSVKITKKQKKNAEEWIKLLESGVLEKEKRNYFKFAIYILRDILGYSIREDLEFEEANIEFTFKDSTGKTILCIEAKGETQDLFSRQTRIKKEQATPFKQTWDNMGRIDTIKYGICTNYRDFILIDKSKGYSKYHFFDFLSIKNETEKLREFIAIFSKESIIDKGFIETLYEKSIIEEREFSKEFYKLYHETRLMLIKEFKDNNITNEKSIHYTQVFLNRLMFVFFAEDTDKLKQRLFEEKVLNLLRVDNIFSENTNLVCNLIKSIFQNLNEGSKRHNIFGFNGGLFKEKIPDKVYFKDFRKKSYFKKIYQNSKIKNEIELNERSKTILDSHNSNINPIIMNLLYMASFDFNTEVNVKILGHIFEQSVSDLEELKEEKVLRRKKEGIYYTPDFITDFICRNTIIPYLSKNRVNTVDKLIDEYSENIKELEKKLKNLKILDPACGSGSFLLKAVEILLEIHKEIQIFKQDIGEYIAKKKTSMKRWQKRGIKGESQLTLIKWNEEDEAREIIENNIYGVDINEESVDITNLSLFFKIAKRNKKLIDLSDNIKCGNSLIDDPNIAKNKEFNWDKKFPFKFDLIVGNPPYLTMTKNNTNNDWLDYFDKKYLSLRKAYSKNLFVLFIEKGIDLLKSNSFLSFIVPEGLFSTRSYSNCVDILNKNGNVDLILTFESFVFEDAVTGNIIFRFIKDEKEKKCKYYHLNDSKEIIHVKKIKDSIQNKLDGYNVKLKDICLLFKGMVVKDRKNHIFKENLGISTPDKFYLGNCMDRFQITDTYYCNYNDLTIVGGTKDKKKYDIFPRIIIRRTGNSLCCAFLNEKALTESTLYSCIITSREIDIKYLLALLNSKLYSYYIKKKMITNIQAYPQILMTDLQLLPIKIISKNSQKKFIEKTDSILLLSKNLNVKKNRFIRRIFSIFDINKSSNKIDTFWNLTFNDFFKEIFRLSKKKLSLKEQDELEDYFNEYKEESIKLQNQINQIDTEINKMIYNLHSLTKEEIEIIEKSL